MISRARTLIIIALSCATIGFAQQSTNKTNTGSISGLIIVEGKPASGVVVTMSKVESDNLAPPRPFGREEKPLAKTVTDEEGRFTFNDLAAGTYAISAVSGNLIPVSDMLEGPQGKQVHLAENENIDDINIPLTRGGIITGRITDADGRPLIAERVTIYQVNEQYKSEIYYGMGFLLFDTDDRGIYRIFGLPPGRYRVSVGVESKGDMIRIGFGSSFYTRTFHPETTEESKAGIIEVTAGSEAKAIDIKVGKSTKALSVTGRMIYADTGQPVEGVTCGYGTLVDGKHIGSFGYGYKTDKTGFFRLQGLVPGKYVAFSMVEDNNEHYSDPVPFEITNEDIEGLEIKLYRGTSISGVVIIEGTDNQEILSKISQLQISLFSKGEMMAAPRTGFTKVTPDGSFRINGVKPGKVMFWVMGNRFQSEFQLMRIERDGVDHTEGLEVVAGHEISGVRIVMGYGTAQVRGQVKFESGQMPEGELWLTMRRTNAPSTHFGPPITLDQRGKFEAKGIIPGEYEITLTTRSSFSTPSINLAKQIVTIANNADNEVLIVVSSKPTEKERER